MIAFLTKSDASEGFEQIIDFLNANVIQYALMINPTIYVSCIKQFWSSVSIKRSNDVIRLQALIHRKKVIITEDSIKQALRLDDADGVDCLPNEEIFAELARMGYEKPSTNLVRNVDSPSKFLMYPRFLQLMINAQVGDLSSHTTKYTSLSITQKVFANMRRIGKGFSGVDTPLFDGMLVPQQAQDVEDAAEDEYDVNEVSTEPTLPSPTPATPPPPPQPEHIPSLPQAETAQPSPPPQQQPSQTAEISTTLLTQLLETCATLTKQVANLEQDKVAQAIEITKLKQRRRLEESQAKVYHLDLEHTEKVLSMQETDEAEPVEVKEVIKVVAAAKLMTKVVTTAATTITAAQVPKASAPKRKRGVIIQDPEEAATASVKRKERQDNTVMRYQALKRKPIIEAQERKNMMIVPNDEDDVEDLEMLWKLFQERFQSSEPKKFSDDFLLNTLKMILLVERKYPLTRFTLEQMLNNVRLEVEEQSEMSLELLRLSTTALSTTEAEYMAMTEAVKEAIWLQGLLDELGINQKFVTMYSDSQSEIHLVKSSLSRKDEAH
nr:retrovirus-related Pol polyprotein from transposon TNT 1-94 [Tanacetum cinerariifolium]